MYSGGEVSPVRESCLVAILSWGAVPSTLVFGLLFVSGWGHLVSVVAATPVSGDALTGVRLGYLF